MVQGNSDVSYERLCVIAERLGLVVPESVPYLENWAHKIRGRMDALERVLTLICDVDHAQLCGQTGIEALRLNIMDDARKIAELDLRSRYLADMMIDFGEFEKTFKEITSLGDDEIGRAVKILREAGEEGVASKLLRIRPQMEG